MIEWNKGYTYTTGSLSKTLLTSFDTNLCGLISTLLSNPCGTERKGESVPRINDSLINEFVHPPIRHDKPPIYTCFGSPAILHPPSHRLPIHNVYSRQNHRVSHGALSCHEALRLGKTEMNVEAEFVVNKVGIHDASAVGKLANVTAEEDGNTSTEHGDAGRFDGLAR